MRKLRSRIAWVVVIIMAGFYIFNSGKPIKQVFRASYMQETTFVNHLLRIKFELPKGWENSLLGGAELDDDTIKFVDITHPTTTDSIQMVVIKPNFIYASLNSNMWLKHFKVLIKDMKTSGEVDKSYKLKEDIVAIDFGNKKGHKVVYSAYDGAVEQCYYAYKVKGYLFLIITTQDTADTSNMEEIIATVQFK